jgi:DNA-binding MarR family transcriptional regulator
MPAKSTDSQISDTAVTLRTAIMRTERRLRQEAGAEIGDLTATSTATLASIARFGPVTPSELAEIERVKRPTMTRTLGSLERQGLIERAPDPADGRSSLVAINEAGRERLTRLRRRKSAYLARRMRELDPEDVDTLARAAELLEEMRAGEAR